MSNNNFDELEAICELIVDCPHSTPKWTDSGFVVIRNQNIIDDVLDLSNPSYTNIHLSLPQPDHGLPKTHI